ncbi:YhgE/Pip domain-containing protein [Rossellomorea vietnamensis]|uniref:YhgE/Pip domain-containing protein n=2 Tax=Rossellomorea TaxID=2837508 RepID=A0A5D4KCI9_9BACI|nr:MULTISPECIES: YhgE/Pip domain-containing protein [Rossellomorea]TYR74882.1 YhgE/Pip domain-containing protein [Rossellomorea vietnamensis]TYS83298.1 YhgE/Pip domain-containing protein [Rossellomorea aquimaris]
MKSSLFLAEMKSIFKNRKLLIPILAVMFIPVLYSGMFLWAFWDPYSQLKDLPVAVVNNDSGAVFEGEKMKLGDELVEKLKGSSQFHFQFVDVDEGYENLEQQEYYMLVEIPENFSENATTLLDEHPEKLSLKYVPNEGFNFLSAQIGDTAIKEIKASLSKSVTETYADTIFANMEKMGKGFADASKAAAELNEGSGKISTGATDLKENLTMLAQKNLEFDSGLSEVKSGAEQLAAKTKELSEGLGRISGGYSELYQGAEKLNTGAEEAAAGADRLESGTGQAAAGLGKLIDSHEELKGGAGNVVDGAASLEKGASEVHSGAVELSKGMSSLDQALTPVLESLPEEKRAQLTALIENLKSGSGNLELGTAGLTTGASELQSGASQLQDGLQLFGKGSTELNTAFLELQEGAGALSQGTQELAAGQSEFAANFSMANESLASAVSGSQQIASGEFELQTGLSQLEDGSGKLTQGSQDLAKGSAQLEEGTVSLSKGTAQFSEEMKKVDDQANSIQTTEETTDMVAEPVEVEKQAVNHVPNYGTGFAPYFLSLGLFVGALLISIVYPLREPAAVPASGFAWFRGKLAVLVVFGVIQSLIADSILLFGLGIEVQSVPLFIAVSIAASLTFIALVQALVTILGDPGRFAAIIILILQLTTSAGTFPLELIPAPLQPISALLPMTYSVAAFKAVISSGDYSFMWQNMGILAVYFLVFITLTAIYFSGYFKKTYNNEIVEPITS